MFLEILGLIFIFVLLAFLPRVVGGIALWYAINAIYWPGEVQMPDFVGLLMALSMLALACMDVGVWETIINRKI